MQTTRQRILDFLAARGSSSIRQLAQALSMTVQNVRHHVEILQASGLLTRLASRPPQGRGRPEFTYSLTPSALPNNLGGLASASLVELVSSKRTELPQRMRSLGQQLIGAEAPTGQTRQRLVGAVKQLTPLGYKPRWEARPNSPEFVLGHCPYAAIIARHPELCLMDASILEDLLGQPLEQVTKLQPGPQGTPQCVFHINKP